MNKFFEIFHNPSTIQYSVMLLCATILVDILLSQATRSMKKLILKRESSLLSAANFVLWTNSIELVNIFYVGFWLCRRFFENPHLHDMKSAFVIGLVAFFYAKSVTGRKVSNDSFMILSYALGSTKMINNPDRDDIDWKKETEKLSGVHFS